MTPTVAYTRIEILGELGDTLSQRRNRVAEGKGEPDARERIDRMQCAYDFLVRHMLDDGSYTINRHG